MATLLPDSCAVVETRGELPDALLPEEAAALGPAAAGRAREFATGRACARRALARLGHPGVAILRGARREPLWPATLVGSITHTLGYRAAAVGRRAEWRAIGIDAEPNGSLPRGVLPKVAGEAEQAWIEARRGDFICWDRLLFSAKESVYKAWHQITGRWLGWEDVVLSAGADGFDARLRVPEPLADGSELTGFAGRFLVEDGWIFTAVAVPAAAWTEVDA
jgi:4'-phosphopantetheinyl transferase EntD